MKKIALLFITFLALSCSNNEDPEIQDPKVEETPKLIHKIIYWPISENREPTLEEEDGETFYYTGTKLDSIVLIWQDWVNVTRFTYAGDLISYYEMTHNGALSGHVEMEYDYTKRLIRSNYYSYESNNLYNRKFIYNDDNTLLIQNYGPENDYQEAQYEEMLTLDENGNILHHQVVDDTFYTENTYDNMNSPYVNITGYAEAFYCFTDRSYNNRTTQTRPNMFGDDTNTIHFINTYDDEDFLVTQTINYASDIVYYFYK